MQYFENTLYINLDHRVDRLQHLKDQFDVVGISGERFPAVKTSNGAIGCTLSHIKCLEMAKSRQWPHVFICEDDITFTNPGLLKRQMAELAQVTDAGFAWDVLIIGGNNVPPYQGIDGTEYIVRVSNIQTTTGYIARQHYYDVLVANYKEGLGNLLREPAKKREFALDIYWKRLQQNGTWLFFNPPTVTQYSDYSDIEGRVTNYESNLLDIDKRALMEYYARLNSMKMT
jgi:hypothetical protein